MTHMLFRGISGVLGTDRIFLPPPEMEPSPEEEENLPSKQDDKTQPKASVGA